MADITKRVNIDGNSYLIKYKDLGDGTYVPYVALDSVAVTISSEIEVKNDSGSPVPVSAVSSTFDHGSNRDIDTTAEQLTATSFSAKFGVLVRADSANTGTIFIGNSDVTAGTTDATDGFPLAAGEAKSFPVDNPNKLYAIGSATNQIAYWEAI